MAERTECNYEEMQAVVKQLEAEAEAINQLFSQTKLRADALHGDGWIGRGADQFFAEMQNMVLPSMARLVAALQQASSTATQITTTYREAEDEAQGSFKAISF
jgi:WXG100 family type VII secretion target